MPHQYIRTVLLVVTLSGVAGAEEFNAKIVKIADGTITYHRPKAGKLPPPRNGIEVGTLPAAADVKVFYLKDNWSAKREAGLPVVGGSQNVLLRNINRLGVEGRIITDPDRSVIRELWVAAPPPPPPPAEGPLER